MSIPLPKASSLPTTASSYCGFCGWGIHLGDCGSINRARECPLNKENIRRYMLQYRPEKQPICVYSSRYQGTEGKGDSFHKLTVSIDWVDVDAPNFLSRRV
jgi:hypothetical protein